MAFNTFVAVAVLAFAGLAQVHAASVATPAPISACLSHVAQLRCRDTSSVTQLEKELVELACAEPQCWSPYGAPEFATVRRVSGFSAHFRPAIMPLVVVM